MKHFKIAHAQFEIVHLQFEIVHPQFEIAHSYFGILDVKLSTTRAVNIQQYHHPKSNMFVVV